MLYGLKQSTRCWYKRFHEYVTRVGFRRTDFDSCVYLRNTGSYETVYLLLYVDDVLVASRSKVEVSSQE